MSNHENSNKNETDSSKTTFNENSSEVNAESFCVCNQLYLPSEFCICCDKCDRWYHGKCVKISDDFARFIEKYYCYRCVANKNPFKGKFVLKRKAVNNNETFIQSDDMRDPNYYYGFDPNRGAVTSRQRSLKIAKIEEETLKASTLVEKLKNTRQIKKEMEKNLKKNLEAMEKQLMEGVEKKGGEKRKKAEMTMKKRAEMRNKLELEIRRMGKVENELLKSIQLLSSKNSNYSLMNFEDPDDVLENLRKNLETEREQVSIAKQMEVKNREDEARRAEETKSFIAKARKSAINKLSNIDSIDREMAIRVEEAIYDLTHSKCAAWYDPLNFPQPKPPSLARKQKFASYDLFPPPPPPNSHSKNGDGNINNNNNNNNDNKNGEDVNRNDDNKNNNAQKTPSPQPLTSNGQSSTPNENNSMEIKEGFDFLYCDRTNVYAKHISRAIHRLSTFTHIKKLLTIKELSPTKFALMESSRLNDIEKTERYRKKCRDNLSALLGEELGNLLEQLLYKNYSGGNLKARKNIYAAKNRELVFNLGRNKEIQEKVREKKISLSTLIAMKEEDLAPAKLKEWRRTVKEEMMREIVKNDGGGCKNNNNNANNNINNNGEMAKTKFGANESSKAPSLDIDFKSTAKIQYIVAKKKLLRKKMAQRNGSRDEGRRGGGRKIIKPAMAMKTVEEGDGNDKIMRFEYSEEKIWEGSITKYKSEKSSLKLPQVQITAYQIGGPSLSKTPLVENKEYSILSTVHVSKILKFLSQSLNSEGNRKIFVAFEFRPSDEDIIESYTQFCGSLQQEQKCPVLVHNPKEFVLYVMPPDIENLPSEPMFKLLRCEQPESCLWAIGSFPSIASYQKFNGGENNVIKI